MAAAALAPLVAIVAGLVLAPGAAADAQPPGVDPPPAARVDDWAALARRQAAPWVGIQRPTGNLPDYLDGLNNPYAGTRYGDAMTGWALLQTGLRESDDELIDAGLRAVTYAVGIRTWHRPSVFEALAVASAYNLARRPLAGQRRWETVRGRWESWLRLVRTQRLHYVNKYGNHWLVDAIVVFELLRSGLKSTHKDAVLGGGRVTARRQAIRLVNIRVPRLLSGGGPFVLSDPPDNPPAYHALSLALYARAAQLLQIVGPGPNATARNTLRRAVRASELMMAPDGDLAYLGRSQEEIWTLPATAYAAEAAGALPGSDRTFDSLADALAERSIERLRQEYPVGDRGALITPALATDLRAGARALDAYAGAPAYDGLALAMLNWAIDDAPAAPGTGDLPADHLLGQQISQDHGRFAVVRRGDLWFAVKMTRSTDPHFVDDLRYDFGIAIAKRFDGERWLDLVPERPFGKGGHNDSAGPVLLNNGPGFPFGYRIGVFSDGRVRITGGFRTPGGRVLRHATFVFGVNSCGVGMTWHGRPGEHYALSAFFRGKRKPLLRAATARAAGQEVTTSPRPLFGDARGGGASGADAFLQRLPMLLGVGEARRISVTYCAAGGT